MADARTAEALVGEPAAGETLGVAGIVQVAFPDQAQDDLVDLGRLVSAIEEGPAQLRHAVIAPGQAPDRALVGVRRDCRPSVRHPGYCSRSKDCIVRSISSAAMSEADWMPWILSLNSSGLLARRRASS